MAIRPDPPTADETGVAKKEPVLARWDDLAVRLGHQDGLALVDRYLGWPHANLERQRNTLIGDRGPPNRPFYSDARTDEITKWCLDNDVRIETLQCRI